MFTLTTGKFAIYAVLAHTAHCTFVSCSKTHAVFVLAFTVPTFATLFPELFSWLFHAYNILPDFASLLNLGLLI